MLFNEEVNDSNPCDMYLTYLNCHGQFYEDYNAAHDIYYVLLCVVIEFNILVQHTTFNKHSQ